MGLSNDLSCEAGSLLLLPQPPGALSIRGLRLYFPALEPWVLGLLHSPPFVQFICARTWGPWVCQWSDCLPRSSHSHTPPVSVLPQQHKSSLPRLPISASPTGLDECLFFISLVSDFLAVQFSVSSGCARRLRVSTYDAILVLSHKIFFLPNYKVNTGKEGISREM